MKSKRISLLLAALLLLSCLVGCSAKSADMAMTESAPAAGDYNAKTESVTYDDVVMEEADFDMDMPADEPLEFATSSVDGGTNGAAPVENTIAEKIIYSGYVNIETTAFDDALETLNRAVSEYGGYIQASNVEGYTRTYADGSTAVVDRWAHYTVRVPAAKYRSFMTMTGTIGNVTVSNEWTENVTSTYTDYEARLESLTIQEERLLELLKESGDLESLILLEERLSEVRYEIESIERNLRNLDQRIAYSTVEVNLNEVEIYTPTVTVTRSFGEKMRDAFADGWSGFVRSIQRLCIDTAENLPGLIVWAVIIVAAVLIARRTLRRRKAKKQAAKAPETKEESDKE